MRGVSSKFIFLLLNWPFPTFGFVPSGFLPRMSWLRFIGQSECSAHQARCLRRDLVPVGVHNSKKSDSSMRGRLR